MLFRSLVTSAIFAAIYAFVFASLASGIGQNNWLISFALLWSLAFLSILGYVYGRRLKRAFKGETGTIKWFDPSKGYGFLIRDNGGDLFVVMFAPFFAYLWVFLGKRNLDPNMPIKFGLGLILMALGFIVMILAVKYALASSPVGVQWLLLTYLLHTFGELTLSPVGLSAFSKYSPKRYLGQMMGIWFLASSLGGVLAGLLGGEATESGLESMSPVFTELVYYCLAIAAVLIVLSFFIKGAKTDNIPDE